MTNDMVTFWVRLTRVFFPSNTSLEMWKRRKREEEFGGYPAMSGTTKWVQFKLQYMDQLTFLSQILMQTLYKFPCNHSNIGLHMHGLMLQFDFQSPAKSFFSCHLTYVTDEDVATYSINPLSCMCLNVLQVCVWTSSALGMNYTHYHLTRTEHHKQD